MRFPDLTAARQKSHKSKASDGEVFSSIHIFRSCCCAALLMQPHSSSLFVNIWEILSSKQNVYKLLEKRRVSRMSTFSGEKRGTEVVFSFHISFIIPFIYASSRNDCMRCSLTRFSFAKKNREHSNLTTLFITTHSPIYARDRMIMRKISNFTRTAKRNNLNKTHKIYSAWMPKIDSNWNDDDDVEYCKCWGNRKNFTCTLRSRNVSHHRLRSHRQQRLRDGLKRRKIKNPKKSRLDNEINKGLTRISPVSGRISHNNFALFFYRAINKEANEKHNKSTYFSFIYSFTQQTMNPMLGRV